jgi:CelD/BcsL family acetyltransferase involved in cellulose biosynthesis
MPLGVPLSLILAQLGRGSVPPSAAQPGRREDGSDEGIRVYRGLLGLEELAPAWDALAEPWASPMMGRAWIHAWADVYGIDPDLEFLVAGRASALSIAPLVRTHRGGLRYELAGPDRLVESMDFLYSDPIHVPALARAVTQNRIPLRFWRVPADSPAVAALTDACRGRALVRLQPAEGCPSLPLDASWMKPEEHLDSKARSNLRRARRIAESLGVVTIQILVPRPEDVSHLLDEAYAVEAAGWKSREGWPLSRDPLLGAFFRKYAALAAESGELRICLLRIGGRTAAMKLGAVTGSRFWLLVMGFDEEFERCSPGTLLLVETLAYAARAGLQSYEFLGAAEPWVRIWGAVDRPHVSLRTYPFSVPGAVALAADASDRLRVQARRAKGWVGRVYANTEEHLAQAYSAGPIAEDAARMAEALSGLGYPTIVGYMSADNEDPRLIARSTVEAIRLVAGKGLDAYVSIKAPALRFDRRLIGGIVDAAKAGGFRVHFDALSADDVDRTFSLIEAIRPDHGNLGTTLPSRWKRSTEDAQRAIDLGLRVRVIRGEWIDRRDRERDWRAGYLEVIDRLAGRVPEVGVATHNPSVARPALRRLKAAGTPCEIEVVRGYPIHRILPLAVAEGVRVRAYVPYGHLAFPYTLPQVLRRPRILLWVTRDVFRGGTSVVPPDPRHGTRAP